MSPEDALDELRALVRRHERSMAGVERSAAHAAISTFYTHLEAATKACDELNVQCRFWRQAAEHAVEGWNALEDKYEHVLDVVKRYCAASPLTLTAEGAYLELKKLAADAPAPPTAAQQTTVDLGLGPMRVVEDDKPR